MTTRNQATLTEEQQNRPNEAPELTLDEDLEQLLLLSRYIPDEQAALDYAQRAARLRPEDPRVQESVQRSLLAHLSRDAFIKFVGENAGNYVVTLRNSRPVLVPKAYDQPKVLPALEPTPGERTLRMVWWMVLGLVPVGVGAVALAPVVIARAWEAARRPEADGSEVRLAHLAIILAAGIGLLGALFALLFLLHLIA